LIAKALGKDFLAFVTLFNEASYYTFGEAVTSTAGMMKEAA
jgi:hypothetical protein